MAKVDNGGLTPLFVILEFGEDEEEFEDEEAESEQ
jgi:hypothetical protein